MTELLNRARMNNERPSHRSTPGLERTETTTVNHRGPATTELLASSALAGTDAWPSGYDEIHFDSDDDAWPSGYDGIEY